MSRALLTAVLILAPLLHFPLQAQTVAPERATDTALDLLEAEITRLAELAGGTVGVAAVHLESGRAVYFNGTQRFPMASTYKVPIAVQLLTRVDRGEIALDSMIMIQPEDLHPGSGTLTDLFDDPGVRLSLRNLLELMLLISDNSATDMVLEAAGGPDAVTRRMESLGIEGIRVDRPTSVLIADFFGIDDVPASGDIGPEEFQRLYERTTRAEREAAEKAFDQDPRDTATPAGMAALLARIWRGEALSAEHTELLLDIMERSTTGRRRIKGLLPPRIDVAHKTGTIGGTTNDVGIIQLPGDLGHVVAAIFVKESGKDIRDRERAIAHIARAIYDYFIFRPGTATSAAVQGFSGIPFE